ncbi:MAG: NADH-quinone oxidoreductase subunit J [Gammaproteobacteria bacterium]|nr:NADH-quinone oxidoreductase subunit J [Gammaproteobacteria bacterium]
MAFEQIIFYFFSAMVLLAGVMVITARNPVYAALFLVMAFFSSSALWLLLEAEFLAITLVLVYVGAVMVLFLFVVMMLDINLVALREGFMRYLPVGALVAISVIAMMTMVVGPEFADFPIPERKGPEYNNTAELGRILYTEYVYPFELAAVILVVAIVAAIALTLRRRPMVRKQNPDQQVSVRKEERVRIVKMDVEKR